MKIVEIRGSISGRCVYLSTLEVGDFFLKNDVDFNNLVFDNIYVVLDIYDSEVLPKDKFFSVMQCTSPYPIRYAEAYGVYKYKPSLEERIKMLPHFI